MRRIVDEDELLSAIDKGLDLGRERRINGPKRRKLIRETVGEALEASPLYDEKNLPMPKLVGLAEAAEILGTKKPYITTLQKSGTLVPVDRFSSGPVFLKADVENLQKQRLATRDERAQRASETK